jgi:hypothetical protein
LLGLLLTDGTSVCDTLSIALLGFKLIVDETVVKSLGFEDTVGGCVDDWVFTPLLGLLLTDGESVCDTLSKVLLGFKLIVGDDTVGD